MIESLSQYFNNMTRINRIMAINEEFDEYFAEVEARYHWYPPFTPEFDASALTSEELLEMFPDAISLDSARFGASIVDQIKSRPHEQSFQDRVHEIVKDMDDSEIQMLPRSLRRDMLTGLNDVENDVDQALRTKLITGGNSYAYNTMGLPPEYVLWRFKNEDELNQSRQERFNNDPHFRELHTQIRDNPDQMTIEDKEEYLQMLHDMHAEQYGYPSADIVLVNFEVEYGEYENGNAEIKFGDTEHIFVDIADLQISVEKLIGTIDHESIHIAQQHWVMNMGNIEPDDPRYEAVQRFADSFTSGISGANSENIHDYIFSAHEADAYSLEESGQYSSTFHKDFIIEQAQDEIIHNHRLRSDVGMSNDM